MAHTPSGLSLGPQGKSRHGPDIPSVRRGVRRHCGRYRHCVYVRTMSMHPTLEGTMAATAKRARAKGGRDRTTTINLRVPPRTRDLIDAAAAAMGKSRTEFMLDVARQHAVD